METIKLSKKVKIKDKEIGEIQLDFDKTTGGITVCNKVFDLLHNSYYHHSQSLQSQENLLP